MEKPNGNLKEFNNADDILHPWRNVVTELHNRLEEFLRLYEHNASVELLLEHSKRSNEGVMEWINLYNKNVKRSSHFKWVEEFFPDLKNLRNQYANAIDELKKIHPDINFD